MGTILWIHFPIRVAISLNDPKPEKPQTLLKPKSSCRRVSDKVLEKCVREAGLREPSQA